jgi:hypothetical protein
MNVRPPQSLRCRYCETKWPLLDHYRQCPMCLEDTEPCAVVAISGSDAQNRARHAQFGWHLINELLSSGA